ncbi:Aste57867_22702 [Aphanomyces stellatus]|uniref:Aste57867_22702 protein n=1 Tax=Aphanomyces stellatus TaxID=120398 RepID=A0A485LMH5_9STRA|nr:hypothetical protein As57867_022632 [Aphanomyces stellatus]VFT99356.1 Aste57867_22702 [Aphanomyces stellatus]
MDETAFNSRKKSKSVIVLKGSPNVWTKTVAASFHLSIVACGSADGQLLPPLFLLPGETVEKKLSSCSLVHGSTVSTSPKGFMNEDLFCEWLKWFAKYIGTTPSNPNLLVFDGLSSHYSKPIVDVAAKVGVILLCLPANATHLFQPIDICVFRPFKDAIRKEIFQALINEVSGDLTTISKSLALSIASKAWKTHMHSANVVSGFATAGLWPLSRADMVHRLQLFNECGAPSRTVDIDWVERRETARKEILSLPPAAPAKNVRKTIDVGGRILNLSLLNDIDKTRQERKNATNMKKSLKNKRLEKVASRKSNTSTKAKTTKGNGNGKGNGAQQQAKKDDGDQSTHHESSLV